MLTITKGSLFIKKLTYYLVLILRYSLRNFFNEIKLGLGSTQFLYQIRASYILFHFRVYTDDLTDEEAGQFGEVEQLIADAIESEWSCEEFIRREVTSLCMASFLITIGR